MLNFRLQCRVVKAVAETQAQLVVALCALEMKGLPIDADEMDFAGRDDDVGSADLYVNAGGFDAGDIDGQLHRVLEFPKVIARFAVARHGGHGFRSARATDRAEGVDYGMHGKNGGWASGLVAAGLQDFLNVVR